MPMPTFLDFHSLGKFTEDDLKRAQEDPRDGYGVKVLNALYDLDSGMLFCLIDAPNRDAVEKHHSKFGIECGWITQVKTITDYDH